MEGAAVDRLGWSKPIQWDSVISLRYETHDLITVHLNEQVKDLCVYLCNLASSSRIPFSLKTEIFFYVLANRPRVPVKTVTENAFSKSSPEKRLEHSALSFSCEQTKTEVVEYGDLINHTAPTRAFLLLLLFYFIFIFFENREKISVFKNIRIRVDEALDIGVSSDTCGCK